MILAVDPGLTGALAYTDGCALAVRDMPTTEREIAGRMRKVINPEGARKLISSCRSRASILVIEDVHGFPSQSASASFTFGFGVGVITGIAQALGYRIERVSPQRWKGALGLGSDKNHARHKAAEIWPGEAELFRRIKDDGRAEAALLAHWGWQVFGTGT